MKINNQEQMDQLLFDYVEGNLSPEQKAEVDALLSTNPDLADELLLWEDSFIEEALPENVTIAEKLIKKQPSYTAFTFDLSFIVLLSFAVFAGPARQTVPAKPAVPIVIESAPEAEELKTETEAPASAYAIVKKHTDKSAVKATKAEAPVQKETTEEKSTEPETTNLAEAITAPEALEIASTTAEPEINEQKTEALPVEVAKPAILSEEVAEKANAKRRLTKTEKKKLRKIRRAQKKAMELKEQEKFMKGNKPYVVPLNPNNF